MEAMRNNAIQRKHAAHWASLALCIMLAFGLSLEGVADPVYPTTGDKTVKAGDVLIDVSHANLGYIMVKHGGSDKKLKVQINCDGSLQNYDLNGEDRYEVYPLIKGSGTYKVSVMENVKGTTYSLLTSKKLTVKMEDNNAAFLCPNQFVWYAADTKAVAKSNEICEGLDNDWDKAQAIYKYVSENTMYDYMKALTIRYPYLPDVDDTLDTGMGICFDYSALFACMMRVQGIPTMMVHGDLLATGDRHAWNKFYIGGTWTMADPTFGANGYAAKDYAEEYYY